MSNRDELINKVTAEVMKIYGVKTVDDQDCQKCSTEPTASSRTPTAITNNSKQRIRVNSDTNELSEAPLVVPSDSHLKKAIMMVCGNHHMHEESVGHFRNLKARYRKLQVLLSANAENVLSQAKGRPYFGHEYLVESMQDLQNWDHFYLVNPTLNTLSKLASLQADNRVALAARKALLLAKPVFVVLDQLPSLPEGMSQEFQRILQQLSSYGYQLHLPNNQVYLSNTPRITDRVKPQISNTNTSIGRIDDLQAPKISSNDQLAQFIDHTLLKPEATATDIEKHCMEARQFNFFSVCVNPAYVQFSTDLLKDCPVKVCTVIGFPLGANTPYLKGEETREIIDLGADEVDMVINIGALKSGNHDLVRKDIEAVVKAAGQTLTKVILETALLSREEILIACRICKEAGANYVKTSTGFSKGGATAEHIQLMRNAVGKELGVKASGGIRDTETANLMITSGASRIGASASIAIVQGTDAGAGKY